jgi:cytidine deaminase
MVSKEDIDSLIKKARAAMKLAYSPYSGVRIGAAVLSEDGRIFTGCNVENVSYGLSCCAERTAVFKAVSEGCRRLVAMAVVGKSEEFTSPCGACRQVMVEFNPKMKVFRRGTDGFSSDTTAERLLPSAFRPKGLSKR